MYGRRLRIAATMGLLALVANSGTTAFAAQQEVASPPSTLTTIKTSARSFGARVRQQSVTFGHRVAQQTHLAGRQIDADAHATGQAWHRWWQHVKLRADHANGRTGPEV